MRILVGLIMMTSTIMFGNTSIPAEDIRQDMVQFDQAFIPLWFHIYEGNLSKAKSEVFYVNFKWQQLKNRYGEASDDGAWQDAFCRTEEWLGDAYAAIDHNDGRLALNQLNHARYELMELRSQYGIPYYLDEIYRFQELVQAIAEVVHDDKMCMLEWSELETMIGRMNTNWVRVTQQVLNANLYELDRDTQQKLQKGRSRVAEKLLYFNDQVTEADQLLLAEAIRPLEREALYQMRLFGKFDAFKTYYASR
jgi:hypothetical protein